MKILITGSNGFIARNLVKGLSEYGVTAISRQDVDLLDTKAVSKFFKNKSFDVVLHCATEGGSRLKQDDSIVTHNNLVMFYNLLKHRSCYKRFINFGSGAELDRREDISVDSYFKRKFPIDPYGMSKNIIARLIEPLNDFHNIRIYNVFGDDELETRFIKSNLKRYIKGEDMIIHQNKLMDFFYIEDLITLVKYYINNPISPKEINCSYNIKYSLYDIANFINNLSDKKVNIHLENKEWADCYIGTPCQLQYNFIGLEEGIERIYNNLKNDSTI